MMVVVTYDVNVETSAGRRRLRQVARQCQNFGQRVQNSVFECLVDPARWEQLRAKLEKIINPQTDSLRFYFLGKNWRRRVQHIGTETSYDPEGSLIV